MSEGFGSQIPGGDQPRAESKGEAQQRLASWGVIVFGIFGLRFSESERDHLAKGLAAPLIRRWPKLAKWKAPKPARVQARMLP